MLSSAAGVVGSGSESLARFGNVASNILSSAGGAAASPDVADQASDALTAALDVASEGVNPAAATSLLGAATSVGESFSASGTGSSVAQGARASKLRVLFSKLGSALLQQVPAGSSSQISTVQDGKGTALWSTYVYSLFFRYRYSYRYIDIHMKATKITTHSYIGYTKVPLLFKGLIYL